MVKFKTPWGKAFRAGGIIAQGSVNGPSATETSTLSAQNSANFYITAEELIKYLGEDIDLFDIDSVSEADNERLLALKALGEEWESSRIDVRGPGVNEWRNDSKTARLVQISCHASNAIRPNPSEAPVKPLGTDEFRKICSISSGLSGTVKKAITLYYCGAAGEGVVVVCVRAAGKWGDWIINGGFTTLEVEKDFIDIAPSASHNVVGSSSRSMQSNQQPLQAHHGFLTAARESASNVASALRKAINDPENNRRYPVKRILFAGHSAGGAVTSLLFAHFLSRLWKYDFLNPANVSLNLITFGSPPILSRNINPQLIAKLSPSGVFLAFTIEGDPVLKLDMEYMRFLAGCLGQTRPFTTNQSQIQSGPPPPMPPLTIHSVGNIIVFPNKSVERDGRDVRMFTIEEDVLGRATWVNMTVHFMYKYLEFVTISPGLKVGLT